MSIAPAEIAARQKRFNERYREYEPVRENGLGRVLRGLDMQTQKPVALLKLHLWINDLSTKTIQELAAAVRATRALTGTELLPTQVLLQVLDDNFTATPFAQGATNQPFVIVTQWFEGISLKQTAAGLNTQFSLNQKLQLVTTLARALDFAQRQVNRPQLGWLYPSLAPDKIYLRKDAQQNLTPEPVLVELGWLNLLSANARAQTGQRFEPLGTVRQLGWLLLCLLNNDLAQYSEAPPEQKKVDAALQLWQQSQPPAPEVTRVLQAALKTPPTIADAGRFAEQLPVFEKASTEAEKTRAIVPQSSAAPLPPAKFASLESDRLLIYYDGASKGKMNEEWPLHELRSGVVQLITLGGAAEDQIKLENLAPRRLSIVYQNTRGDDRYTITDTGNGVDQPSHYAHLDNVPLSPVFAALLLDNVEVKLGAYRLRLKRGVIKATDLAATYQNALLLNQKRIASEPGAYLSIPLNIKNPTNEVDRFWLVLDGQPREWQVEHPEPKQLFQGESAAQVIGISLPPLQKSTASAYKVTIRLISVNLQAQVAATSLTIEVLRVVDYSGYLDPEQLHIGQDGVVRLENQGNFTRAFKLNWRDRNKELIFEPNEASLTIYPSGTGEVIFRPYVRKWRWLGAEKVHNFSVQVTTQQGVAQNYPGQVVSRALVPRWAVLVFGVLLAACVLLVALLLRPDFAEQTLIIAPGNGAAVTMLANATPMAGVPFSLRWTPIHSCFVSVYQDDKARRLLEWQTDMDTYPATPMPANEGSKFEVHLSSCLLLTEKIWTVKVAPAPTAAPTPVTPPTIRQFVMSVENQERLEAVDLPLPFFTATPTTTPDVATPSVAPRTLLLGQTGQLCFQWQVTGHFAELQLKPPLIDLKEGETQNKICSPISQILTKPGLFIFTLQATYANQQSVSSPELRVNVLTPTCYLNTEATEIKIREGPGRDFAERGQLQANGRVLVTTRPFYPREQADAELWLQVTLPGDARPAWVAYKYLACNGDVLALPASASIPPTPTPTPTPTPMPTLTPTPVLAPLVAIEPEVIAVGGCALLKWNIQQVKDVHLNGEGVVGVAQKEACPGTVGHFTYTWTVTKLDGSTMELQRTLIVNPASAVPVAPTPP